MTVASPATALEDALRRVDEIAERRFGSWHVPGIVYGVIADGRLVHSRGLGTLRVGDEAVPDARSVFRVASMTKSFTAATVLSLRDDGLLALDDRIDRYVPELANLRYPTADSPPVTIRHLLTMTAGFPTDDPWGDRQQGLDLDEFGRFIAAGLGFAWAPGTRYEYSNVGYAILGRMITNLTGLDYREAVGSRILSPLGLLSTGYDEDAFGPERLARGYIWRDGRFVEEPMDRYGAFAPMGGLFSCLEDLAAWVGFLADAFPPRDEPGAQEPLARATRREMQQPMVDAWTYVNRRSADAPPDLERTAYGYGLNVLDDVRFGRIVGHNGGYPGFGSNMRWHLASGLGMVCMVNHRYGPAATLNRELMGEILRSHSLPRRRTRPGAATETARNAVEELLRAWDDETADRLFAMNVDLDEPLAERKAFAAALRERHGVLSRDAASELEVVSPYQVSWWLDGSLGGRVKVEIMLSPELPPKIQLLGLTSVPEPPAVLRGAADAIVGAMRAPEGQPVVVDWPPALKVGAEVDVAAAVRSMRAAEAGFAPMSLGRPIDGDGATKATFVVNSPRGALELALSYDPVADCLAAISLAPEQLSSPLDP